MTTINCNGKLVDLSEPKIMGILNITPDSFYDGGKFKDDKKIVNHVGNMLEQGATFIDVGAYSSRPGAAHISESEELRRIVPVVQLLFEAFPDIVLSIDTFRSAVADKCLNLGASMINDISSGSMDSNMFSCVASYNVPYVMMHMQGNPQNMQDKPTYESVVNEVMYYFSEKIAMLRQMGINDLIADVGFGFGKTIAHNYELLHHFELFKNLDIPLLAGLSRKSMLFKPLGIHQSEALNATTAANTMALMKGANILRVHDVKQAREVIEIVKLESLK